MSDQSVSEEDKAKKAAELAAAKVAGLEKREKFYQNWFGLFASVMILFGVGVQPLLPLLDPMLFMLTCLGLAVMYPTRYIAKVYGDNTALIKWAHRFGVLTLFISLALQAMSFVATINELNPRCHDLRSKLLKGESSEVSDTYTALNCVLVKEDPLKNTKAFWKK